MKTNPSSPSPGVSVSRRSFFGRAAAAAGTSVLLTSAVPQSWATKNAGSCGSPGLCDFPVPIPHFFNPIPTAVAHFFFPGPVEGTAAPTDPTGEHPAGRDPSVIFNLQGSIGQADFVGITGTGIDLSTGDTAPYLFNTDMRFMTGVFVGTDGIERHGSFVFI